VVTCFLFVSERAASISCQDFGQPVF